METNSISSLRKEADLKPYFYNDKCDKNDYLIAIGCGAIAGLIDIFLVGAPGQSSLGNWTDEQTNKAVMEFAKISGWSPPGGSENNVKSAIGFLENTFRVNYDQRHSGDINNLFRMSAKNHHMKSLGHAPDILGLFFSLLSQFTSTSFFLDNGALKVVPTEKFEIKGNNFVSKIFYGTVNWFGHIMSDIAGSSGAVGRGSGIVMPFYELFQFCDFGSFQVGEHRNTIAKLATKVFEEGYDARHAGAMAIPVVVCELMIKLLWAFKHYFYHKRPLNECIPTKRHDDLRLMLIIGDGTLCLMDGVDAAIRSGGNWVKFFLRLNIIAWFRLLTLVFKEVCLRVGISLPLQRQLDFYIRINQALSIYLSDLEKIDFDKFKEETNRYNELLSLLEKVESEEDLTNVLRNEYKSLGLELPYEGNFNDFMESNDSILVFK